MPLLVKLRASRTRYGLLKLREQLEIAQKAHDLLEEKYRILLQEADDIKRTLVPFQHKLQSQTRTAYSLLSEAVISLGVNRVYRAAKSSQANDELEMKWSTLRGISIPRLTSKIERRTPLERGYELTSTNSTLDQASEALEEMLNLLIEVTELENMLQIIEREVKKIGVRVSALEKVLIPSLKNEARIIENSLEERDREGHITVKWIKDRQTESS